MDEWAEEIKRLLGGIKPFSTEVADSVFTAIAPPEQPIKARVLPGNRLGEFDPSNRQIAFDIFGTALMAKEQMGLDQVEGVDRSAADALSASPFASILAHELFHQETIDQEDGEVRVRARDPQMQGLLNAFGRRWEDATPEQRNNLYESYYGKRFKSAMTGVEMDPAGQDGVLKALNPVTRDDTRFSEIFAKTGETAFEYARRANQGDVSELVDAADEQYPGVREFFNFFIRRFPREE